MILSQANEIAAEHPAVVRGAASLGPNVWPTELPGFGEDAMAYYNHTTNVSRALFKAFAAILHQPPTFFDAISTDLALSTLRMLRYVHVQCCSQTKLDLSF